MVSPVPLQAVQVTNSLGHLILYLSLRVLDSSNHGFVAVELYGSRRLDSNAVVSCVSMLAASTLGTGYPCFTAFHDFDVCVIQEFRQLLVSGVVYLTQSVI